MSPFQWNVALLSEACLAPSIPSKDVLSKPPNFRADKSNDQEELFIGVHSCGPPTLVTCVKFVSMFTHSFVHL